MAGKNFPLNVEITAVDRITAPMRKINDRIKETFKPIRTFQAGIRAIGQESGLALMGERAMGVAGAMRDVGHEVAKVAAGAVGLGYVFKRTFVDTAATFEKYQAVLTTIEGSGEKAKRSLGWVSDFAAKTPFEMQEVLDAFVKLRAYGMNPMNGLLKTLGDTSSAMGKDLNQAVEAIADAVTGENERLKEFGIRARKTGNTIVYEYSLNGKTMTKRARANSREMIQATLEGIFNSKYKGAMEVQSKTWNGMISNMADQWTRFTNMVMEAGAFDWLKTSLAGLLAEVDRMAASGELKALAEIWGKRLVEAFEAIATATGVVAKGIKWLADTFGGTNVAIAAFAVTIGAPLIVSIGALVVAIGGLVATVGTIGGAVTAAGVAVAAGVALIWAHWDELASKMKGAFAGVRDYLKGILDEIVQFFTDKIKAITDAVSGIGRLLGFGGSATPTAAPVSASAPPTGALQLADQLNRTTTNNASVRVQFDNLPQGSRVTSQTSGVPLLLDSNYAGRAMAQ